MSEPVQDPAVRRAIDDLRRLPPVDAEAVRRVVEAAAAARLAPSDGQTMLPSRRFIVRSLSFVGVAAAAACIGFVLRGSIKPTPAATIASAAVTPVPAPSTMLHSAASSVNDALPVPQQFVLHDDRAHRVSVVGDFNQWNPARTPMMRSPDGALWSVTVPVLPGRHIYGFMLDDSAFILDPDPRAPRAHDTDLGVDGSVVIVGRP